MDKYKKITDLGIEIHIGLHPMKVMADADSLLKVLDAGVEVYSDISKTAWTERNYSSDTHSGLVIDIKELKPKQVTITRADLINAVRRTNSFSSNYANALAENLGL